MTIRREQNLSRRIENENQDDDDDDSSVIIVYDSGDNDDEQGAGASDVANDITDKVEDEPENTFWSDQISLDPMDEDNEYYVENMETIEEVPIEVDDQFRPIPLREVSVNLRRVDQEAVLNRDETIDLEADEDPASPRVNLNVNPMIEDNNDVETTSEEAPNFVGKVVLRHRTIMINLIRDETIDLAADEEEEGQPDHIDFSSQDTSNHSVSSSSLIINHTNSPTVSNNNLCSEHGSQRPGPSTSGSSLVLTCPVCQENFVDLKSIGVDIMTTSCGHLLCALCLDTIMQKAGMKCPLCRYRQSERKIHKIHI